MTTFSRKWGVACYPSPTSPIIGHLNSFLVIQTKFLAPGYIVTISGLSISLPPQCGWYSMHWDPNLRLWHMIPRDITGFQNFLCSLPDPPCQKALFHPLTTVLEICNQSGHTFNVLSTSGKTWPAPDSFFQNWERDLNINFSPQQIDHIAYFSLCASICNKNQEMIYKLLTK